MKILNNKKLLFAVLSGTIGIALLIYAVISIPKNSNNTYNGELNVTTPQMYIQDFSSLAPGCNDPSDYKEQDIDPQLDILTVNQTDNVPVNIQHIITIYAKALETEEYENINAGDYLDASKFYISNEKDGTLVEAEDKYFILNNKTTVLAKKYSPEDGEIIAVRYYVPGEFLNSPSNDGEFVSSIDSYKIGLSMSAPMYYITNSEINVTVKTQATADDIELGNWITVDSNIMYSTGYDGTPIDINDFSRNDTVFTEATENTTENIIVTEVAEPEIVETTIPDNVETLAPTTSDTNSSEETTTASPEVTEGTTAPVQEEQPTETTTSATTAADTRVFPEGMSINTGSVDLKVGESYSFSVTFDPVNTTETGLTWVSNNTSVATVDSNGKVTAIGEGTASISVTSVNGMVLTVYVNVKSNAIYPEGMTINTGSVTLNPGESYKFSVTFDPVNATETGLTWVSSDTSIATVDNNGNVTAVSAGTASITVTSVNGMVLTVQVNVN